MQQKVCHYKISKTESRPCVFNQLRTEGFKKAQTWARPAREGVLHGAGAGDYLD
jgi:hypothetical protein